MPGTGKHEVTTRQQSDGTFEFVVDDSEAMEVSAEGIDAAAESAREKPRIKVLLPGILLVLVAGVVALALVLTSGGDNEEADDSAVSPGFRPYSAAPNSERSKRAAPKIVLPELDEYDEDERVVEIEAGDPADEMEEGVEAIIENDGEVVIEEAIEEEGAVEDDGANPQGMAPELMQLEKSRANIREIGRSAVGGRLRDKIRAGTQVGAVPPELMQRPQIAIPIQETVVDEDVIEESEEIPDDVEIIEE